MGRFLIFATSIYHFHGISLLGGFTLLHHRTTTAPPEKCLGRNGRTVRHFRIPIYISALVMNSFFLKAIELVNFW